MKEEKQINYNDPTAARWVENVSGWVDINNRFFGSGKDSEHLARYSSCTHETCSCGHVYEKGWSICPACREKKEIETYNKYPFKEYDGSPVYSLTDDKYFFDENELDDYISDQEESSDLRLVFCIENHIPELDPSYFGDELPEDGEIPDELQEAIDKLNELIKGLPVISYSPGRIRTTYNYKSETIDPLSVLREDIVTNDFEDENIRL